MKLLKPLIIIQAINNARHLNSHGLLPKKLQNITNPEFWKAPPKTSILKKKQIIELAKTGKPKPTTRLHPLKNAYRNYSNPAHRSYDPILMQQLQSIRPDWFFQSSNQKKEALIQLAKSKQPRPKQKKHPLAATLNNYINPNHGSYDPTFTKKIKSLAPLWFVTRSTIAEQKKQKLLKMAQSNQPRPHQTKHPLGAPLTTYMNKNSRSYDPVFTNKIKTLAPDWFTKKSDIKKQQLIKLAKSKAKKPINLLHPLGAPLSYYTTPKSSAYDPTFTKLIKSINPEWFISRTDNANQKKLKLLQIAKAKQPKPIKPSKLYLALIRYINKSNSSYDPIFTKKIKAIAPHWFRK
jgi:hypothetical protein